MISRKSARGSSARRAYREQPPQGTSRSSLPWRSRAGTPLWRPRTADRSAYFPNRSRCPRRPGNPYERTMAKRKDSQLSLRVFWQREKDSNPHIRSQSPLCYLYTIPLCSDEQKLLYRFSLVCQQFFRALLPFIFTSIFPTTAAGVPTAPQRGISTHIRCPLL